LYLKQGVSLFFQLFLVFSFCVALNTERVLDYDVVFSFVRQVHLSDQLVVQTKTKKVSVDPKNGK
jgi:hypothetical protein